MKRGDVAGMVPQGAAWRVAVRDLPQVWRQWESLEAAATLQETAPPFMHEGSVALRKITGVRPTPSRVDLWLGPGALLAGNDEEWCLSFRPGIALRVASAIHGLTGSESAPGIRRWGTLFYAWHQGLLLVAPGSEYLADVLDNGTEAFHGDSAVDSLSLSWSGESAGTLEIVAQEGLPIDLNIPLALDASNGPLRYTENWPEAMLVWNDHDANLAPQLGKVAETLAVSLVSPENVGLWRSMLTSWWQAQSPVPTLDHCGGEGVWMYPAPGQGADKGTFQTGRMLIGCDAPVFQPVEELESARPYQWDDRSGWLVLSPRHQASWSGIQQGDLVAWSNDTDLVPQLIDAIRGEEVSGALHVRMRWAPAMLLARDVIRELATKELIPGLSVDDVESHWLPYLNALGGWQLLAVTGEVDSGRLHLQGKLAATDMRE